MAITTPVYGKSAGSEGARKQGSEKAAIRDQGAFAAEDFLLDRAIGRNVYLIA
jgi:hypothetical protein